MEDALRMHSLQRVGELQPEVHDVGDAQGLALASPSGVHARSARGTEPLHQRLALEQFHCNERRRLRRARRGLGLANVVDGADVRMVQRRRRSGLPLKPFERLAVAREVFGKELERDAAAETRILGRIDNAHATRPECGDDSVSADRSARSDGQRCHCHPSKVRSCSRALSISASKRVAGLKTVGSKAATAPIRGLRNPFGPSHHVKL